MNNYSSEIRQQSQALVNFVNYYKSTEGQALLGACNLRGTSVLFTGMGASFHAGQIGAHLLQRQGIDALAIEAVELLNYIELSVNQHRQTVYISQSGNSGEIRPLADKFSTSYTVAITNEPASTLGELSSLVLPLQAGDEVTVATKTYLNTLALLYLLLGNEPDKLLTVARQIEKMLETAATIAALWLEMCADVDHMYFLGHGAHAVTAKQAAMMVSEWAKFPAAHAGIGAFRHGFIESVDDTMATIIFASPGATQSSSYQIAEELHSYGARVLLVEAGTARQVQEEPNAVNGYPDAQDEILTVMLDTVATQIFVEAFANHRRIAPGFLYIQKVVKRL